MMLKEGIEYIAELAKNSAAVQKVETGNARECVLAAGGKLIRTFPVPPNYRDHELSTLAAMIEFVRYAHEKLEGAAVVWHSHESVKVVLDDADRRDLGTLCLKESIPFQRLKTLEGSINHFLKADTLLRLLRLEFGVDDPVLSLFRRLRWGQHGLTTQMADARRESLGQEIQREVAGVDQEIPDEIMIQVPVYETPGETASYPVRLLIEPALEAQAFIVIPPPGTTAEIIERHQCSIHERLFDELPDDLRLFAGSP